ncbi:MAG: hypothetical protein M1816_006512 [Peltula sp. TS41687]|nr:MAG: hypothetical protein M1816_006512 [Peltula sp. TS41687]
MAHMQAGMYAMPSHEVQYGPPVDGYPRAPPPHVSFNQPAPRQRTAIACRYCRRRKIRCSGFESSEDGRCTNCQRFNQECIFTPVSSQAQAFVPAHTAYPHLRNAAMAGRGRPAYPPNAPVIYGAHGQPLNAAPPQGPYPPDPGYPHHSPPGPYGLTPPDGVADQSGRRRGLEDAHGNTLPPPIAAGRLSTRRGSSTDHQPGPLQPGSPASSTASYHPSPYYPETARRSTPPPPGSYPYDRASSSPRDSPSGGYPFPGLHPPPQGYPQHIPAANTPPPLQRPVPDERRSNLSIQNLLDPGQSSAQSGRSATDREMLSALMHRGSK